jgi:YggT family protein
LPCQHHVSGAIIKAMSVALQRPLASFLLLFGIYSMDASIDLLAKTILQFVNIYTVVIFIRILLSWFPNIDWFSQPFATVGQLTDPYLNLFRSIIPPLGGLDFSPMLAIFALQLLSQLVSTAVMAL